jgi:thymidylate synthase
MRQLKALAPAFEGMAPSYVTYGPRLAWQLHAVFDRLLADWTSRQAIATVYMPEDFHKGYPDCPCTMSLQFLVRLDDAQVPRLHLICTMRSNDIWYGTPTDIFMFTFLQRQMAASLGYEVGHYVHQAGSIHVYEEHWEKVIKMLATPNPIEFPKPELARYPGYSWSKVRVKAAEWLDGSIKGKTWVKGLDL